MNHTEKSTTVLVTLLSLLSVTTCHADPDADAQAALTLASAMRQLDSRVSELSTKVDTLSTKIDALTKSKASPPCSALCTCGCNTGGVCTCGNPITQPQQYVPQYQPTYDTTPYYQPQYQPVYQSFSPSFGSYGGFSGGSFCSPGIA